MFGERRKVKNLKSGITFLPQKEKDTRKRAPLNITTKRGKENKRSKKGLEAQ